MAKLTLTDITSGFDVSAYNANNTLIESAVENTLSRDGTTPNQMSADIDMNSNDINNIGITRTTELYLNGVKVTGLYPEDLTLIGSLLDVTLTATATNDILQFDGAEWVNVPLPPADVTKVGTPVDNQIAVWTGDGTLEGDASLTWSGTLLTAGNYAFDIDQVVGAGQDNYVLTYNDASGEISLEEASGGDVSKVGTPVDNQIGVWTGDGTIEGDADLTWNGTGTLTLGGGDPALIHHLDSDKRIQITGGNGINVGGEILLYGTTGFNPGDVWMQSSGNTFFQWDESVGTLSLYSGTGVKTIALTIQNNGDFLVQNGVFVGNASETTQATFRVPHGTAPTVPINGDIWSDTLGIYARVNAVTYNLTDTGGDVTKVGTPVADQVGVWTGDGTLAGFNRLTWDGSIFTVGAIAVASPEIALNSAVTGNPRINLQQNAVNKGQLLYQDSGDIFKVSSVSGSLQLLSNNTEAVTFNTSQIADFAAQTIRVGRDTGGDSQIELFDDTANVYRSIRWNSTTNQFETESSTGAFTPIGSGSGTGFLLIGA